LKQRKEDLRKPNPIVRMLKLKLPIAEATAIREKEAATFASESGDLKTNIAAVKKAVGTAEDQLNFNFG